MARRKRQFLDDGDDSDSSGGSDDGPLDFNPNDDPDVRAERELFENPYGRKRRRKVDGKEDATYGVFGEDSEDEGFGGRPKRPQKRSDWTKAPAFISGEKKVDLRETVDVEGGAPKSDSEEDGEGEDDDVEDENGAEDDGEGSSESESSEAESEPEKPPSPRVRMEEDEAEESVPRPKFGGIGMRGAGIGMKSTGEPSAPSSFTPAGLGFSKGGIGSTKGGIGSGRGGIGSGNGAGSSGNAGGIGSGSGPSSRPTPVVSGVEPSLPSNFGGSRPQRAFVRDSSGSGSPSRSGTPLSAQDAVHFSKLSGTFGAKMLQKMGWQAGSGLGTEGTGIVTPVESKLRPKGMGIAFKGFKEKTEQSKAEARRRGEKVSDDEDEKTKRRQARGKAKDQAPREDAWKKPRKSKVKVKHKTYEEIIAEAGEEAPTPGIGKIIDATGATLREVSSLADVSLASWTPSTDPMRIPEVRHNLRLIAESCKVDLDGLAREAKALAERKKWVANEDPRLRRKVEDEAELIQRLQAIHLVVDDINTKAKEVARSDYEPSLEAFSAPVEKLLSDYSKEYDRYRLDEIVVAAIVPTFRRMMASWNPLSEPSAFTSVLRKWRNALKMTVEEREPRTQVDVYGTTTIYSKSAPSSLPMTPYDSLLWNIWLPKIRSCINNDWTATQPAPIVNLLEAWTDILPSFIHDNILDQLILPKVSAAISNWNPKKDTVSLQAIVFPWLPHIGLRMEGFLDEARRKVKSMLRHWATKDGMPKDLLPWKEVFDAAEWESLLLKYVLPRLGATLRDEFRVNPRAQDMAPLARVLEWAPVLRPSVMGQLLETELLPKWLDVLHLWLTQPAVDLEEVVQWYQFWKAALPEQVGALAPVERGFTRGLQMMNEAVELGPDAPKKLPKPEHRLSDGGAPSPSPSATQSQTQSQTQPKTQTRPRPARTQEITFRSIVEEFAAAHDLLFMPAGKVHARSRMPLFRVARSVDGARGRGGLLVYLLDDAVWAPEDGADPGADGGDVRAITLEDMVLRASKAP